MISRLFKTLAVGLLCWACSPGIHEIHTNFTSSPIPPTPDYSKSIYWATLPDKKDAADSVPLKSDLKNQQASAKADVFFIYPTIYTKKPTTIYQWNADVNNATLNEQIQKSTILNQASAFNGSCRVYTPFYRQAHLYAFYTPVKSDGNKALHLAYEDVKTAFEYYLKNYNNGRPIIIASHSQGSYHGERLMKEYFDGKPLQKQLVAAYLVGRAIKPDAFKNIRPTEKPEEFGVWASWNTFGRSYFPKNYDAVFKGSLSTNPLLWNSSEEYAPRELNKGGVALKFTLAPNLVDAQNHQQIIWVNRPHIRGSGLVKNKNWHRADYNFFYMNIRENAEHRIEAFLRAQSQTIHP
jgi:hypothetical protein